MIIFPKNTEFYKMDRRPILMPAQQENPMDHDTVYLREKAAAAIVDMYHGAGVTIDAKALVAEAEVLYQWLLNGASAEPAPAPTTTVPA